jgi:molecular chaperone GrpE
VELLQENNKKTVDHDQASTETEEKIEKEADQSTSPAKESEELDTERDDEQADEHTDTTQREMEELKQEKDELYDRLLRVQAEYDNFKKRTQKEKESDRKYRSKDLVEELLPVLDNFERALQVEATDETKGLIDGITMVYNQFQDALKSQGVEVIEAEGKEFDPNIHHAVMQADEDELDPNIVVEELQKGYMLKDKVVRPAMVKVNK